MVAGVDFSETGNQALARAFALANKEPGSEVHAVWVMTHTGPAIGGEALAIPVDIPLEDARQKVRDWVEKLFHAFMAEHECNIGQVRVHLRSGGPAEEIAQLAADLDADMVIVGTHGRRGVRRFLLGSVAEGAVRLCHCPVLVVRPKDHGGAAATVPSIEPPCAACLAERKASNGEELWCEEHGHKHGPRHTYHSGKTAPKRGSMPPMVW